jgi:hypothetical protein
MVRNLSVLKPKFYHVSGKRQRMEIDKIADYVQSL